MSSLEIGPMAIKSRQITNFRGGRTNRKTDIDRADGASCRRGLNLTANTSIYLRNRCSANKSGRDEEGSGDSGEAHDSIGGSGRKLER
jgi:hypothetical protein